MRSVTTTGNDAAAGKVRRPRERELIARWGAGAWRGWSLRAGDGARYTIIYQGRPGGPAGPDFRDAVLMDRHGERITGDIELHLSPAGWRAHGHGSDPRYNALALHITLTAGRDDLSDGCALASGRRVPLVALAAQEEPAGALAAPWPCERLGAGSGQRAALRSLIHDAGWARFEERVALSGAALADATAPATAGLPTWSAADAALFIALAEGLGYGRDRATLRACGERLAHGHPPDALLSTHARAGAVERRRLEGLLALRDRWRATGPLAALTRALGDGGARAGAAGAARALTEALRIAERGAVSPGRARILAFNVALPFVVALASGAAPTRQDAPKVAALAQAAVQALSGLPSNQITREMTRQLGLPRLPGGALAQQGLQHLWAHHCREKRCDACPCAALRSTQPQA